MKIFYTDHFVLPLPSKHRFPMTKYSRLRKRITETALVPPENLCVPEAATDEQLCLAHEADYVRRVTHGQLTNKEIRQMGFPWSLELVERSRRSVGATIAASRAALTDGISVSLAGGTHHAFRDHGQGFCVFNDAVVAARTLQAESRLERVVIIDCDVHQGNGTAALVADDSTIFTFSMHGAKNFPFRKEQSDLDIPLDDNINDDVYLAKLEWGLPQALRQAEADLAIYLAGADPYEGDRLGRLALSKTGLARRDQKVFELCRAAGLPIAVTMSGGYAPNIEDIVTIHFETVRQAWSLYLTSQPPR